MPGIKYSNENVLSQDYNITISLGNKYSNSIKTSLSKAIKKVKNKLGGLEKVIDEEVDNFVRTINSHALKEKGFDLGLVKVFIFSYVEYGKTHFTIRYDYVDEDFNKEHPFITI